MRGTEALNNVFLGNRVSQENDRSQQYCLNTGHRDGVALERELARITGLNEGTRVIQQPYVMRIQSVEGNITLAPYTFTNEDLLADNWMIAEGVVTAAGGQSGAAGGD